MENGFLFTQVMALSDSLVRLDLSQLRNALKRKVDFAIQIFSRKEISNMLSKAGIPFAVYGNCATAPDGCVGNFRYSLDRATRSFAVDCRKRGIGSVEVVCCDRIRPCASQLLSILEGAGIRVSVRWLKAKTHIGRTHSAEQVGYDFICRNAGRSSSRLPDAYLVHDDYLARGMLTALNVKGFHVPEDVGFVCVTQKGFAPVFAKALTRIEMDSYAAGAEIAKRVLAWLLRKVPIGDDPVEAVYVNGSTLA